MGKPKANAGPNDSFYRDLPALTNFADIVSASAYRPVPGDWWVIMTDVVGSTRAIEAGRYKDVNSAGSLTAMAISNYLGHMDFPFIFGGDGMTCLLPASMEGDIRGLLSGIGPMVKLAFDLELRLAMVPVTEIIKAGKELRLARWVVSPKYSQAIVEGNGLDYAETLMKTPGSPWLLGTDPEKGLGQAKGPEPDLSGYSCRWQDYPSQKDETIALIVKFRVQSRKYVQEFVQLLDRLIGQSSEHHPLTPNGSQPWLDLRKFDQETILVLGKSTGFRAFFYKRLVRMFIRIFLLTEKLGLPFYFGKKNLSQTRQDNVLCSDYRKYDNSLKMIVAVSTQTRQKLEQLFERERAKDRIFYGIHVSDRAMITCLMHAASGQEVHFVDAADGGYAYAARQLKQQVKTARLID